jgi:predicted RNA-binding protein
VGGEEVLFKQYWLVVGTERNWKFSFENGNLWGLKNFRETLALWNLLQEGDKLLVYVSKPVSGVVGIATVTTKFRQTNPLWPEEIRRKQVLWPLRFEFGTEYCLSPLLWESRCYRETNMQLITRMVFQCIPAGVALAVRTHFGLQSEALDVLESRPSLPSGTSASVASDHSTVKQRLCEIGRIQGFLAEEEYPIESNRLDVVWRRVERSVPTYAFEVQVGGDIYHALAKLKHAFDLWNSHIFLAASLDARPKFEELVSGTFHEIAGRVRFIQLNQIEELYKRKISYRELERELGIIE